MLETRELKLATKTITASIRTDAGCVREANEDAGRHIKPSDPEKQLTKGVLTVVADGMGGHASGEIASRLAVEAIGEFYYADRQHTAIDALRKAIELANEEIYEASRSSKKFFGMGTTVIALVLLGDVGFSAHVGDSRLYRRRGRDMQLLTLDHSEVMEMVKRGVISLEEARNHDDKNIILRAVGTLPNVEVEMSEIFTVKTGDEFLLCSDGLCDMLDDDEIRRIWADAPDIHSACESLIERAKQSGGHDNITVGIVRVAANEPMPGKNIRVTRETGALA